MHLTIARFARQSLIFAFGAIAKWIMKSPSTSGSETNAIRICDDILAAPPPRRKLNICPKDCPGSKSARGDPPRSVPAGYENALTSSLSRRSNH